MGDAENADQTTPDSNPNPPPPPPIVSPDDQRVLGETEAQEREKEIQETRRLIDKTEAFNRGTKTIEWLQFSVNAALAVIGVIAIFIYYGQLCSMNRTLSEIQRQTPVIQKQAQTAQDQLAQAKIDSKAASIFTATQLAQQQKALKVTESQFQMSERPIVVELGFHLGNPLDPTKKAPQKGQPISVNIDYINTGKSPALRFAS